MKNLKQKLVVVPFLFGLLFLSSLVKAQTVEEDWQCGFSTDSSQMRLTESIQPMINTSLKVGMLLVQFADWDTNIDARGGVGWTHWSQDTATMDTFKFRYKDYWN